VQKRIKERTPAAYLLNSRLSACPSMSTGASSSRARTSPGCSKPVSSRGGAALGILDLCRLGLPGVLAARLSPALVGTADLSARRSPSPACVPGAQAGERIGVVLSSCSSLGAIRPDHHQSALRVFGGDAAPPR
jgi:hypothetical protein